MTIALNPQGDAAFVQGDLARALASYAEALQVCHAIGDLAEVAECLEGLAAVAAQQHELEHAVWLCGGAAGLRDAAGMSMPPTDRATYEHIMRTARAALGDEAVAAAWEGGQTVPLEQAVAAALAQPQTRS